MLQQASARIRCHSMGSYSLTDDMPDALQSTSHMGVLQEFRGQVVASDSRRNIAENICTGLGVEAHDGGLHENSSCRDVKDSRSIENPHRWHPPRRIGLHRQLHCTHASFQYYTVKTWAHLRVAAGAAALSVKSDMRCLRQCDACRNYQVLAVFNQPFINYVLSSIAICSHPGVSIEKQASVCGRGQVEMTQWLHLRFTDSLSCRSFHMKEPSVGFVLLMR